MSFINLCYVLHLHYLVGLNQNIYFTLVTYGNMLVLTENYHH